jgi:hypothetical protein
MDGVTFAFSHSDMYGDLGLTHTFASAGIPFAGGGLAVSYTNLDSGPIPATREDFPGGNCVDLGCDYSYAGTVIGLSYGRRLNLSLYVREFENRDHWFVGAGAGISDYALTSRLSVSAALHYWDQPADLGFNTATGKSGGAVDISGSYRLGRGRPSLKAVAVEAGMVAKTAGFLPEEMALDRHVGFRVGLRVVIAPFAAPAR